MRKNNSKLDFTKNRGASWRSHDWLKISKCSNSLARMGECWKNKVTPRHVYLNILPKLWKTFCCNQQKIQKIAISDILKTITIAANMITRQMTPIFSSLSSIHGYVSFQDFQNWIPWETPLQSFCSALLAIAI